MGVLFEENASCEYWQTHASTFMHTIPFITFADSNMISCKAVFVLFVYCIFLRVGSVASLSVFMRTTWLSNATGDTEPRNWRKVSASYVSIVCVECYLERGAKKARTARHGDEIH